MLDIGLPPVERRQLVGLGRGSSSDVVHPGSLPPDAPHSSKSTAVMSSPPATASECPASVSPEKTSSSPPEEASNHTRACFESTTDSSMHKAEATFKPPVLKEHLNHKRGKEDHLEAQEKQAAASRVVAKKPPIEFKFLSEAELADVDGDADGGSTTSSGLKQSEKQKKQRKMSKYRGSVDDYLTRGDDLISDPDLEPMPSERSHDPGHFSINMTSAKS